MGENLLRDNWTGLDATDLRLFLNERVGGPGQHNSRSNNADELYLPLAGSACRIVLIFREKKIVSIEPGQAFEVSEWNRVCEDIERSILAGPLKVGREYSFSSFRVLGSWRGNRSGVQILPPPGDAPRAHVENGCSSVHPRISNQSERHLAGHQSPADAGAPQPDCSPQRSTCRTHEPPTAAIGTLLGKHPSRPSPPPEKLVSENLAVLLLVVPAFSECFRDRRRVQMGSALLFREARSGRD